MQKFAFGGNTGQSYENLQNRRKVAEAMLARSDSPQNVGEGIHAIGKALMARTLGKRADAKRAELDEAWNEKIGGLNLDPARAEIFSRMEPGQRDVALLRILDQRDAEKRARARSGASAARAAAKQAEADQQRKAIAAAIMPKAVANGRQMGPTMEAANAGAQSGSDLGILQTELQERSPQQVMAQLLAGGVDPKTAMSVAGSYADLMPEDPKMPSSVQEYEYYAGQEREQGRDPVPYGEWSVMDEKAALGPTPPKLVGTDGQALFLNPETNEWGMQVLPGSKLAMEQAEAAKADENASSAKETAGEVVITAADRALTANTDRALTGVLGSIAAYNPSSNNAEVYRQAEVLKSVASAEALNAMRRQSKTGGALGNVTEKELKLLSEQAGALDPRSPNFERDLKDYTRNILRTIHGKEAGDAMFADSVGGEPSAGVVDFSSMPADQLVTFDVLSASAEELKAWNKAMDALQ